MARNFAKEKKMILKILVLFNLIVGLCVCSNAFSAASSSEVSFPILFSANVNGELESCG